MTPGQEIAAMSDEAVLLVQTLMQEQYKMGFEYALYCAGLNNVDAEVMLRNILKSNDAGYVRALLSARK